MCEWSSGELDMKFSAMSSALEPETPDHTDDEAFEGSDSLPLIVLLVGAALGGLTGLMLTIAMWASALVGWEPRRSRRGS
jgi:hypothetical protein